MSAVTARDEFVRAAELNDRLDDPRLGRVALDDCVREIAVGIRRANRCNDDGLRGMSKCRWVKLLAKAAERSPAARSELGVLLDDPDGHDVGGYDPWWELVAEKARDALAELGAPAVPVLVEALAHGGARARAHAAWALERIGPAALGALPVLERAASDPERDVRIAAGSALGALVDGEAERLAFVRRLLAEAPSRVAGLVMAWKLVDRTPLVAALRSLLRDPQERVRELAANHLQLLEAAASDAAEDLLESFERETDEAVRLKLLEALQEVGTSDPAIAEALFRAVMEREPRVAYRALLALSKREPHLLAPFVAPLLRRFQTAGDALGTELAVFFEALGETAPADVVAALANRLDAVAADDERAGNLILRALESMGPAASSAVPAVERATRHARASIRDNAAKALVRLG